MCPPTYDSPTTTRITLGDQLPELTPGSILEIDLLGSGARGLYASLLACSAGGDSTKAVAAVELLELCLERLELAIETRVSRNKTELWAPLLLRLDLVEQLLDESEVSGAHEIALIVSAARKQLLRSLQDGVGFSSPVWASSVRTLTIAQERSSELGEQVEDRCIGRLADRREPVFVRLEEGLSVSNVEDLARGLELVAEHEEAADFDRLRQVAGSIGGVSAPTAATLGPAGFRVVQHLGQSCLALRRVRPTMSSRD